MPPPATPSAPTAAANSSGGKLTYTPLEPLPGGDNSGNTTYNSLSKYLTLMFNILLSLGSMIAVITLVVAGITYMVSEVAFKKIAARQRIVASFIGLGLLLTSWLILYTINPKLVQLCIFSLDQQCGGAANAGTVNGGLSPTAPNPTPSPSTLQQNEQSCKSNGALCAYNPVPGQPGQFSCDCGNAL